MFIVIQKIIFVLTLHFAATDFDCIYVSCLLVADFIYCIVAFTFNGIYFVSGLRLRLKQHIHDNEKRWYF